MAGAVTPDPSEVRSRGGMNAKRRAEGELQHVVGSFGGEPNVFSLIGHAICRSWDGLQGRILPLKGRGETGTRQTEDREDDEEKPKPEVSKSETLLQLACIYSPLQSKHDKQKA
ncbi:unnamed protein product [Pleuronectes platessa]|uniref:Uncharacterized protein n=1 Tax=Pleuronectes platessa TaxID=8262 RepID=A0A9N7VPB8_PLEPL|nr:unnamed protein product [Pleuronectes platessa]